MSRYGISQDEAQELLTAAVARLKWPEGRVTGFVQGRGPDEPDPAPFFPFIVNFFGQGGPRCLTMKMHTRADLLRNDAVMDDTLAVMADRATAIYANARRIKREWEA